VEQLIDEMIFRAADRQVVQTRLLKKRLGINTAAMGRIEHKGNALLFRFANFELFGFANVLRHRSPFLPCHNLGASCMLPVGSIRVHSRFLPVSGA
jgi:hypothetical protein